MTKRKPRKVLEGSEEAMLLKIGADADELTRFYELRGIPHKPMTRFQEQQRKREALRRMGASEDLIAVIRLPRHTKR